MTLSNLFTSKIVHLFLLTALVNIFMLSTAQATKGVKNSCPKNCYPMHLLRVIDGDSVQGYIHTNDKESVIYATFRLNGVDTPETRRAQCSLEKLRGLEATLYLKKTLAPIIQKRSANYACACDYHGGKFANRRIGELKIKFNQRWQSFNKKLLKGCYAVPYTKGQRPDWCNCLKNGKCPSKFFSPKCLKIFSKLKN